MAQNKSTGGHNHNNTNINISRPGTAVNNKQPGGQQLSYQQLKKLKADIHKLEKSNRDSLILYQYRRDWWRMGGNSALIYYHLISKQIGTKPKLLNDRDFYSVWPSGVISVHYLDPLKDKLIAIGAKFTQHTADHISFRLPRKLTAEEVKTLSRIESAKEQSFNRLVLPNVLLPGTYAKIRELTKVIIDKVNKVDAYRRQLYADEGAQLAWHLERDFIAMSNGRLDPVEYFQSGLQHLDQLADWIAAIKDYHVFDNSTNLRTARLIIELKSRFTKELHTYQNKHKATAPPAATTTTPTSTPEQSTPEQLKPNKSAQRSLF